VDVATISAALAALKSGFDTARSAIGLAKDVQQALPPGEKKEEIKKNLEEADKQMQLSALQIAQALGYQICHCDFPPSLMFRVGYREAVSKTDKDFLIAVAKERNLSAVPGAIPLHECPRCGQNDAGGWGWKRKASQRAQTQEEESL
jgi:hypothetical protein